jgi:hypothetical protein
VAPFVKRSILGVLAASLISIGSGTGCSDCDLKIGTDNLPDGFVGVDYSARIDSDCGGDQFFFVEGRLPPGIEIQSDGDLRGTPITAGDFLFTIGVVDFGSGDEAVKGFQITVH